MNLKNSLLIFVVSLIFIACGSNSTKSNDTIVHRPANDPELEQARQEALSNLDYFIESFHKHSTDTSLQHAIKTDFVEDDEHEHMWISLNKIENGYFEGLLANDPVNMKNIKYGDFVKISKEQIEDWIIFEDGNEDFEGGYSVKILNPR